MMQLPGVPSIATLLCVVLGNGCLATVFNEFQFEFEWKTSEWSRCERLHHPVCCSVCVQTRKVTCLHSLKNITVPRHFCHGIKSSRAPNDIRECEDCEQDCVVSTWTEWSPCNEKAQRQYRTRQVLVLPSVNGAPCRETIDTRPCPRTKACPGCERKFRWKVGKWSECQETDGSVPGMGSRSRSVECTNRRGNVVKAKRCTKQRDPDLATREPPKTEVCLMSQDCEVSEWTTWSPCSRHCLPASSKPFEGVQSRTRKVIKLPQNGGLVCPLLEEEKPCQNASLPKCTSYSWYTSFWSDCTVLPNTDLKTLTDDVVDVNSTSLEQRDVRCGPGWQQRTVYCTRDSDKNRQRVNQLKCVQDDPLSMSPPTRRPCEKPCPQPCQLGEWSAWSPCSQSCGAGGVSTRSRPVLVEALYGGEKCPVLSETRPCSHTECSWWYIGRWMGCYTDGDASCGRGLKSRYVYCQSIDDRQLNDHECSAAKPKTTSPCTVPCHDCDASEWSEWSACSRTCGPKPGFQSRKRTIGNVDGDCKELDLTDWQQCGPVVCRSYSWRVGVWGECMLNATSGVREKSRQIICVDDSAPDRPISESHCPATPRPSVSQSCEVVESRDCIMTSWSDWTACSSTCGDGRQVRRRQVLVREKLGEPCPEHDAEGLVFEYRACVRLRPCPEYKWSIDSTWSHCSTPDNGCGTGIVTRLVHCKYDGKVVDNALCMRHDGRPPVSIRQCYLRCPSDCTLSPWSEFGPCSQTCGSRPGVMVRKRYFLAQRHRHGAGALIHDSFDSDYNDPPPMPSYAFLRAPAPRRSPPRRPMRPQRPDHASRVLDHAAKQFGRFKRALDLRRRYNQARRLYDYNKHLRRNYRRSDYAYRSNYRRGYAGYSNYAAPSPYRRNEYGNFVYRGPYYRDSPRIAPVLDPSVDAVLCSNQTGVILEERVPCGQERCPNYNWEVGEWGSCMLNNESALCGPGTRFRNIQCRREAGVYAHRNQCLHQLHARPLALNACELPCPRDCQVTQWSSWTPCSAVCGQGTRQRYRGVLVGPSEGGRPCPVLDVVEVCTLGLCSELQWQATEWSGCEVDYNLTCGTGLQTRQVYCPAGESLAGQCELRSQRPVEQRTCEVSCRGNCVMSEWSEFYPCDCETSVQYRHRTVIRNPAPGGYECGRLTESRRCRCPKFTLKIGNWTACERTDSVWQSDVQRRSVACIQDGRHPVSLSLCGRQDIQSIRSCELPVDRDCIVGEFGPWSPCGECGARQSKQRHRNVIQSPSGNGKPCPPKYILTQNTTCGLDPCNMYNYHWYVGAWSDCVVEDLQNGKAPVRYNTSQQCGFPCPKDCQVTEWSLFGPCYRNCSNPDYPKRTRSVVKPGRIGYRVRTRSVIKPAGKNGLPCPRKLIDVQPCGYMAAVCPSFQWNVNDWSSENRDVYCVSQGGMEVEGGCVESLRPLVTTSCTDDGACSVYGTCDQSTRQCTCSDGYEGDGRECFPNQGCNEDSHCPINSTRCDIDKRRCICPDGSEPYKGSTCNRQWMLNNPINADDSLKPDKRLWIIVAVCSLVLILIVIVVTALLLRRQPRDRAGLRLHHMVSNNLNDIPKKVSNEYVNIKGAEKEPCRLAGPSQETPTASNPHYIYMNSEYKVQPRMGTSSSNVHLAVNTDELDDEVFTDNSEDVFLDPNHDYDDEVFLSTPEDLRRKKISTFRKQRGSGSAHDSRHGSQTSTSTGPPACVLPRKRLSTDSSRGASTGGGVVVRDKPSSASGCSSSSESLKNPPSPPDYTPPPPPPPRPDRFSPKFFCPQSPKPELPPRRLPPLSMRRVATPVETPTRTIVQPAPRSRSSQDLRLPTLLCNKSSSESEAEETAPLRQRDSDDSEAYLHLCEATWR